MAAKGFGIFPCHRVTDDGCTCLEEGCKSPGKHPRNKNGSKGATTDEKQIREWWTKWGKYNRLNFGATLKGRAVVDVDVAGGKPGLASWATLKDGQSDPATLTIRTGRGGTQYVYSLPDGEVGGAENGYKNQLAPAVDFKTGPNSYVMVPGSKTVGVYTVETDAPDALLPTWVATVARSAARVTLTRADGSTHEVGGYNFKGWSKKELWGLPADDERRGNNWLASLAGHIVLDHPNDKGAYRSECGDANAMSTDPIEQAAFTKTTESIWNTEQRKREAAEAEPGSADFERAVEREKTRILVRDEAKARVQAERSALTAEESLEDALEAVLAGDVRRKPGVFDVCDDAERGLFYGARINGLYGDQATAKTLLIIEAQARTLNAGGIVVHWDFDNNNKRDHLQRLRDAATDIASAVRGGQFFFFRTAKDLEGMDPEKRKQVALVTLDALSPAISMLGLDVNHPSGADMVLNTFMTPFTVHGATGLFIDHVGHDNKERQAGSIRKSQAVQGALYEIKLVKRLEWHGKGQSTLTLRKDNGAGAGKVGEVAAYINLLSTGEGPVTTTVSRQPLPGFALKAAYGTSEKLIIQYMKDNGPGPFSWGKVQEEIKGNAASRRAARDNLIAQKVIGVDESAPKNGARYYLNGAQIELPEGA